MSKNIWKDIKGYEGRYKISSDGRVKELAIEVKTRFGTYTQPEHVLVPRMNNGYLEVNFDNHSFKLHRLVASHFVKNPQEGTIVKHINECKTDNNYKNLIWLTHSEHTKSNIESGRLEVPTHQGPIVYCVQSDEYYMSVDEFIDAYKLSSNDFRDVIYNGKSVCGKNFKVISYKQAKLIRPEVFY